MNLFEGALQTVQFLSRLSAKILPQNGQRYNSPVVKSFPSLIAAKAAKYNFE